MWLAFGAVGGVLAYLEYGASVLLVVHFFFAALISLVFYVAWSRAKVLIGGADVKAIMALSIAVSYVAILSILWAAVFAFAYAVFLAVRDRLKLEEALAVQVPYVPFLLVGFTVSALMVVTS